MSLCSPGRGALNSIIWLASRLCFPLAALSWFKHGTDVKASQFLGIMTVLMGNFISSTPQWSCWMFLILALQLRCVCPIYFLPFLPSLFLFPFLSSFPLPVFLPSLFPLVSYFPEAPNITEVTAKPLQGYRPITGNTKVKKADGVFIKQFIF